MADERQPRLMPVPAADAVVASVIPTYQEAAHIERCLNSLIDQTWPAERHIIHVVDGGSTDHTREIVLRLADAASEAGGPEVHLIDNPGRFVSHARNTSLSALPRRVTHIFEANGHAWAPLDHLERRMADLTELSELLGEAPAAMGTRVVASDGVLTRRAGWIEAALSHPLGSSGGQFATFSGREATKVPPFSLYDRRAVDLVGGWNEAFITSQDSELNQRLRRAGWPVWRSDVSHLHMHKRDTLRQWWRMGHRYGFWRTKLLLRDPMRATPTEFGPWLGFVATMVLALLGMAWWWALPATYGGVLLLFGVVSAVSRGEPTLVLGLPLCLLMLHTSFSLGLVDGMVRPGGAASDRADRGAPSGAPAGADEVA